MKNNNHEMSNLWVSFKRKLQRTVEVVTVLYVYCRFHLFPRIWAWVGGYPVQFDDILLLLQLPVLVLGLIYGDSKVGRALLTVSLGMTTFALVLFLPIVLIGRRLAFDYTQLLSGGVEWISLLVVALMIWMRLLLCRTHNVSFSSLVAFIVYELTLLYPIDAFSGLVGKLYGEGGGAVFLLVRTCLLLAPIVMMMFGSHSCERRHVPSCAVLKK